MARPHNLDLFRTLQQDCKHWLSSSWMLECARLAMASERKMRCVLQRWFSGMKNSSHSSLAWCGAFKSPKRTPQPRAHSSLRSSLTSCPHFICAIIIILAVNSHLKVLSRDLGNSSLQDKYCFVPTEDLLCCLARYFVLFEPQLHDDDQHCTALALCTLHRRQL